MNTLEILKILISFVGGIAELIDLLAFNSN